jgi:predicted nucleotidyltransferase
MVTGVSDLPMGQIEAFCKRWRIREFALFGSILRDDFGPESDVDVMVAFEPDHGWSLLDFVGMRDELVEMLGRPVDVVTRSAVERSRNPYRRHRILTTARTVYAAA